jgi:hypothetical protein
MNEPNDPRDPRFDGHAEGPGGGYDDGDDVDPGEPIAELTWLRATAPEGFLQRIRGSILRRVSGSEAVDFCVMGLFHTFWEYLALSIQALGGASKEGKGR